MRTGSAEIWPRHHRQHVMIALAFASFATAAEGTASDRFTDDRAALAAGGTYAAIPHEGGRIELRIVDVRRVPWVEVRFLDSGGRITGHPAGTIIDLHLPQSGRRQSTISFRSVGGRMLSTVPLRRIPDASTLVVSGSHGHRFVLREGRP